MVVKSSTGMARVVKIMIVDFHSCSALLQIKKEFQSLSKYLAFPAACQALSFALLSAADQMQLLSSAEVQHISIWPADDADQLALLATSVSCPDFSADDLKR